MIVERINQAIKVRADFHGGQIVPLFFKRGTRNYKVTDVHARWEWKEGQKRLYYFSVSVDTGDVCELCLDGSEMLWYLESVMMEG